MDYDTPRRLKLTNSTTRNLGLGVLGIMLWGFDYRLDAKIQTLKSKRHNLHAKALNTVKSQSKTLHPY